MQSLLIVLIIMPIILLFLSDVVLIKSLIACFLLICISSILFYLYGKRPKTSEWVSVFVFSFIAVFSRCMFVMLEQFKPMAGIVIIAGLSLGPIGGLLTGMLSGFLSSPVFGYGAWVPVQMYVFGLGGFLFGNLGRMHPGIWKKNTLVSILSGMYIVLIGGPILDFWSISFKMDMHIIFETLKSGLPFNCIHGIATMVTVFLLCIPICKKMQRMRDKYGIMEVAFDK